MAPFLSVAGFNYPTELLAKVVADAESDADGVATLLAGLGLGRRSPQDPPARFPAAFLLGLGAVVRLIHWEQAGLTAHLPADLPSAQDALQTLLRTCQYDPPVQRDRAVVELGTRLLTLAAQRLAWEGPAILGAEVLLGAADEDLAVEALALFAWHNRHLVQGGPHEESLEH